MTCVLPEQAVTSWSFGFGIQRRLQYWRKSVAHTQLSPRHRNAVTLLLRCDLTRARRRCPLPPRARVVRTAITHLLGHAPFPRIVCFGVARTLTCAALCVSARAPRPRPPCPWSPYLAQPPAPLFSSRWSGAPDRIEPIPNHSKSLKTRGFPAIDSPGRSLIAFAQ